MTSRPAAHTPVRPQGSGPVEAARVVHPRPIDHRRPLGGPVEHLVPNLMIVGVTHAGAGQLARLLARHSEIKRPVVKRIDLYDPMRYDRPVVDSLADYDRHFATWTGQRYRLECAPTYFDGGPTLVRTIARDIPDLNVVILLRNPAVRLWAGYQDKVASGRLPRAMSYPVYVERCLALRINGAERFEGNRYFRTLSSGLYAQHLDDWLNLFGRRVRVVFREQLEEDPAGVSAGIHRWLGLDPLADDPVPGAVVRRPRGGHAGMQTFDDEAATPSGLRRFLPEVPSRAGRLLRRAIVGGGTRPPRTRADSLYQRANRDLADRLTSAGYVGVPRWVTG